MELKREKEDLALEVEREEELLTNTLQKKLNQVMITHTDTHSGDLKRFGLLSSYFGVLGRLRI